MDAPGTRSTGRPYFEIGSALDEFLAADFPPREYLLEGLLQEKGIATVYAWCGVGKTWAALGLGLAMATGGTFLKWEAKKVVKVAHVDGEMAGSDLRNRLNAFLSAPGAEAVPPGYYRIISADTQPLEQPLPDLSTREGQAQWIRYRGCRSGHSGQRKHAVFERG